MPAAYLMLLVLGVVWASRLAALKFAIISGLPAHATIQIAVLGIAVGLTLLNMARRTRPPLHRRAVRFYLISGLLGFICPFALEAIVAARLPVFVLILIVTTTPVWTVLVAATVGAERLSGLGLAGVALGFAAAGLVVFDTAWSDGAVSIDPLWCLLALAIPLFYAVFTVFVAARWPPGVDAVQVAQGNALAVSIAVIAAQPFQDLWRAPTFTDDQALSVGGVVLTEIVGLLLYLRLARDRGATFVTQANYVAICAGAALGALAFGDHIGWLTAAGAVMVVLALRLARPRMVGQADAG